jgi:hypothetical protein
VKLAIIFEVPDGQADAYADVAARMIQHHQFSTERGIEHWSFHQEMRPTAAAVIPDPDALLEDMVEAAEMMVNLLQT